MCLPLEVYGRVREKVGADYCVGTRILGNEVVAMSSDGKRRLVAPRSDPPAE